jgi:hypothetical protein
MTGEILEYLNRQDIANSIRVLVDQTNYLLMNDEAIPVLDRVIAPKFYADTNLLLNRIKHHRPTVGTLVSKDAEIPPSRPRMTLTEDILKDSRIGKKLQYGSETLAMLRKLNMMSGTNAIAFAEVVKEHFFGEISGLVPAIQDKARLLSTQIALTGACTFSDPISKVEFSVSYTTVASHMPAALTGNARWNQPTNASCVPLDNLRDHAEIVYYDAAGGNDNLGRFPDYVFMNRVNLRRVADSNQGKTAYLLKNGVGTTSQDLTTVHVPDQAIKDIIGERVNPRRPATVVEIDAMISEEQADGTITDKFLMDVNGSTDYYFFAWDGYIERAFVPCEEDGTSGIFIVSGEQTNDIPFKTWTTAVANYMPIVLDPRQICARKVV